MIPNRAAAKTVIKSRVSWLGGNNPTFDASVWYELKVSAGLSEEEIEAAMHDQTICWMVPAKVGEYNGNHFVLDKESRRYVSSYSRVAVPAIVQVAATVMAEA